MSFYIKKTDLSKYTDSAQYELVSQDLPQRSTIDRIQNFFPTLATGADMLVRYLSNYGTVYTNYKTISFATSLLGDAPFTADGAANYKTMNDNINDINEIRINLLWGGTNATNQVKMSHIEVEYNEISTKQQA